MGGANVRQHTADGNWELEGTQVRAAVKTPRVKSEPDSHQKSDQPQEDLQKRIGPTAHRPPPTALSQRDAPG